MKRTEKQVQRQIRAQLRRLNLREIVRELIQLGGMPVKNIRRTAATFDTAMLGKWLRVARKNRGVSCSPRLENS